MTDEFAEYATGHSEKQFINSSFVFFKRSEYFIENNYIKD